MLIQNAIQTPDGTILISKFRHDHQKHIDNNGKVYMVDGGLDYIRASVTDGAIDLSLRDTDSIELISDSIIWGTRPASADGKVVYRFLVELETDHLKAIAKTQKPSIWILMSIFYTLNERKQLWV